MQQINLYLPEFRPNREPLRTIHMIWGSCAFLVLLVLISIYTNHQNTLLQEQLASEQKAQQALQGQLQLLSSQKPTQPSADLDAQIQQLQKQLQRRQQILAMMSHQDLGNEKGFSAQLNALAHASLNTISLDAFSLQKGGSYAELSGKATSADQIPLYLLRLRDDPSFTNVGFGVLSIERDELSPGLLQFSLSKVKKTKEQSDTEAEIQQNKKVDELFKISRYKRIESQNEKADTGDKQ